MLCSKSGSLVRTLRSFRTLWWGPVRIWPNKRPKQPEPRWRLCISREALHEAARVVRGSWYVRRSRECRNLEITPCL